MSQTEGGYSLTTIGSDRLSFPSFCIYNITQNQAGVKCIALHNQKNRPD